MHGCARWVAAIAIVGVCSITLGGCTDPAVAQKSLESAGFTDITLTGNPGFLFWFRGCGEDTFATGFVAKNPQGKTVSGAVCNGWFKGGTIRF
jgi:hypothetical protein